MRPRNKHQARILNLSKQLLPLGKDKHEWAFEKCIPHTGFRSKKGVVYCLSCGEEFTHNLKDAKCPCPYCNRTLKLVTSRKRTESFRRWAAFISVIEGFQLVRYIEVNADCKAGQNPKIHSHEILQQWFGPNGKLILLGKNRYTMGCADSFIGEMEIRIDDWKNKYSLWPDKVHPDMKVMPIYKRNGIKSSLYDVPPHEIFGNFLNDSMAETLLKAKQYSLFRFRLCSNRSGRISRYWRSIKIAIRNNYRIKDATMWIDYLDLLEYFRKDVQSPKYILPVNLKREHDRLMVRKRAIEARQDRDRERRHREAAIQKRKNDIQEFMRKVELFSGLSFTRGDIHVCFIESIEDFKKESEIHNHCVYDNAYYGKQDSLIFSALVNGKRMETVEFSLEKMKVIQSRGKDNATTNYHDEIIRLVEQHAPAIQSRMQKLQEVA